MKLITRSFNKIFSKFGAIAFDNNGLIFLPLVLLIVLDHASSPKLMVVFFVVGVVNVVKYL